ncbi:hypothetical protein L1887_08204 [Cichorium endivia]|nr:hypothetical protein L1887_08204 [Cichorium endivia]
MYCALCSLWFKLSLLLIWKIVVVVFSSILAGMFTIHGLLHPHRDHFIFINKILTIFFIILFAVISVSMALSAVKDCLHFRYYIFKTSSPTSVAQHQQNDMDNKHDESSDQV